MNFLLLMNHFPNLNKKDIDSGNISENSSKIASIFRAIFLLSNGIRSSNNLIIYCIEDFTENKGVIIDIKGEKLRYLSPDERSTLLILLKVYKIIHGSSNKKLDKREIKKFAESQWAQSTPGIYVKKCDLEEFNLFLKNKQKQEDYIILLQNSSMNNVLVNEKKQDIDANIEFCSEFDELNGYVRNNSLFIIFVESLETEFASFFKIFDKVIMFKNQKLNQHFFDWNIIALIQTIFENKNN